MITASQSRGEGGKSLEAFWNLKFYKCDCLIFIKLTVNFSVVSMRGGIYPLGWVWRDGRIEAWKMTDVGGWHTQVSWQLTVHIQASKCRENFCPESWQHEYEWKYAAYEVLRQSGMFKKKKTGLINEWQYLNSDNLWPSGPRCEHFTWWFHWTHQPSYHYVYIVPWFVPGLT